MICPIPDCGVTITEPDRPMCRWHLGRVPGELLALYAVADGAERQRLLREAIQGESHDE